MASDSSFPLFYFYQISSEMTIARPKTAQHASNEFLTLFDFRLLIRSDQGGSSPLNHGRYIKLEEKKRKKKTSRTAIGVLRRREGLKSSGKTRVAN
jgi:hypothetical protein